MAVDMLSRCRLCAEVCCQENDNIFTYENEHFVELVSKYVSVSISSNDTLPMNICEVCRQILKSFDEFVMKCNDTQLTLRTLLEIEKIDVFEDVKEFGTLKLEVKYEDDVDNNVEQIKSEKIDYSDDGADDFCEEDTLPLATTSTKKRKCKVAHWTVKKSKTNKKKKLSDPKLKKSLRDPKLKKNLCEPKPKKIPVKDKIKKKDAVKKPSVLDESVSIQSSFFNFICHVCDAKFKRFCDLNNHTLKLHSQKPRVLCVCSKYITLRKQLLVHSLKHIESFGVKCPKCPKKFVTDKYLRQHTKVHDVAYKCSECNKEFTTSTGLRIHANSHIPIEIRATYQCDLCESKFASNAAMILHKKAVHENDRPFICDGCGKGFVSFGVLNLHKMVHKTEPRFACPQCPRKFKAKAMLKRHLDYHNGVTYKCPECPALFPLKQTLETHFRTHRDVYKYICGYCDKKFKWSRSLQSHINNHTGATPYKCDWCPKTFADGSNCRIHKRRQHPVELAEDDAKKAALNPKAARKETTIIKEIKVKDPSLMNVKVFPKINMNDNGNIMNDECKEDKNMEDSLSSTMSLNLE